MWDSFSFYENTRYNVLSLFVEECCKLFSQCIKDMYALCSVYNCKVNYNTTIATTGVIYSVDQDKAVIWQTCPKCDKEELALKKSNEER